MGKTLAGTFRIDLRKGVDVPSHVVLPRTSLRPSTAPPRNQRIRQQTRHYRPYRLKRAQCSQQESPILGQELENDRSVNRDITAHA